MSNRILVIGFEAEGERIDRADFGGETALDGYAWVVADPAAAHSLWLELASAPPADPAERTAMAERAFRAVQRRRREATELLRRGGSLVCFLRPVGQTLRLSRPDEHGTRSTVLHAYSWLPEEPSLSHLVIVTGVSGEIRPADEAHPAWRLIQSQGTRVCPVACATTAQMPSHWHPIATDAAGRLLAFEVRAGQGRVVFLPPLGAEDPRERGTLLEEFLVPRSGAPEPAAELAWLSGVQLPGQAELGARVAELAEQIEALEREFIAVRRRHARLGRINTLLLACTPGDLASPAAAVLQLLGFRVETVDASSLLVACEEGSALVVLAAAEDAVPSDAYWELIHRLDDGPTKASKGIIVANGFCTLPPDERGAVFPDLLQRGALHREVCLVPTTELHRAAAALLAGREQDAALLSKLRKALLETTGPCVLSEHLSAEGGPP
ncbi:MAG TPA: hypothetical protein VNE39_29480 [Planctomycetota bacterium]|nr:hypothetical protein [Planctomycetota bacterium]